MVAISNSMSKNSGYLMSDKKQSIYDLASWFLEKEPMSHKKLQKLCYYAVAWGYTLLDQPIVEEPQFEAWIHGPVSKYLWSAYGIYGWELINKNTQRWKRITEPHLSNKAFPQNIKDLLESVWATYGSKSGLELEALSHKEAPWSKARNGISESQRSNTEISPTEMKKYYKSIYIAG
jgi:uncharacterized phage-associated protein